MKIDSILSRALRDWECEFGSTVPPLFLSTAFHRPDCRNDHSGEYYYTRVKNPNRSILENVLAQIESGEVAFAFSSGSAAITAVLQTLSCGDHVIVSQSVYHGTRTILEEIFKRWGLSSTFVDTSFPEVVARSFRENTRVLWLETPGNPMLSICNLSLLSSLARDRGAITVVDNTLATPVLQQPLQLGCDIVVHSLTKSIGGHSDSLGGAVIAARRGEVSEKIQKIQTISGAVLSPFDCWLILRGARTLPLRVRYSATNALKIAQFLSSHPAIEACHYPGLKSHPQYELACQQMRDGFGGIVSFQIVGDANRALKFISRLKSVNHATSFGGVEASIEHRASIEPLGSRVPCNLLRLSVGLDSAEDSIADLETALAE